MQGMIYSGIVGFFEGTFKIPRPLCDFPKVTADKEART